MAAVPQARLATSSATTIYDSYPLRRCAVSTEKGLRRSKSHAMGDAPPPLIPMNDPTFQNTCASLDTDDGRHSPPLPFGNFPNEVFETKERSKVVSALRHRGKGPCQSATMKKRALVHTKVPSTFTTDDVVHAGMLTKQGSWRRNWKMRFFILRSDYPCLCYFTSEEKLELLGEIAITEDTIILDRSGGHVPYRFQVRTEAQTLLLEAESREVQHQWMTSCQELADAIRVSKFSIHPTATNGVGLDHPVVKVGKASARVLGGSEVEASGTSSVHHDVVEPCTTSNMGTRRQSQVRDEPLARQLYDVSLSLVIKKQSPLARAMDLVDKEKDRTACFVTLSGLSGRSHTSVELGVTDMLHVSQVVATSDQDAVPFSLVLTADLASYEQLQVVLCKSQWTSSPGTIQSIWGVGQCRVTKQLLASTPCTLTLTDWSPATLGTSTFLPSFPMSSEASESVQVIVHAFASVPPQRVLPTTGIDMANAKYLIPTTLAVGNEATDPLAADAHERTVGTIMAHETEHGHKVRYVAVDEILRVPRSTFALPIAFLDFLEEEALERSRGLQKSRTTRRESERVALELDFLRKKQEEILKQRQFLIQQEKRLVAEATDGTVFQAVNRTKMVAVAHEKEASGSGNGSTVPSTSPDDVDLVAPFKRSTSKNLNVWQYVPTNMQDQFLCTRKPRRKTLHSDRVASDPFVWHTMTMGCPAAHTKGFANGGYPATVPIQTGGTLEDDGVDKSQDSDTLTVTSCVSSSKSSNEGASGTSGTSDDSIAAFKVRLELHDRLNVIGSQILSAAAACILASLDLAASGSAFHQAQVDRAPTFGFLIHFESLLSTQGKEYGMLEDFAAGARWLRNVLVQFRRHSTTGTFFSLKRYTSTGHEKHSLLLTMGIDKNHMAILPQSLVSGDSVVALHCVLFTQGVNEKQSLVHAYKSSAVKLQERVNRDNFAELKRIYALYHRLRTEETVPSARRPRATSLMPDAKAAAKAMNRHDLQALDALLLQIEHHICSTTSQYKKNVTLLMDSSDFCRALGGARVTCCKSGKDRTAMSVTLEQTRLLCTELQTAHGHALCANMRLYGVRRRNVFLNTKADKFAFNEMQRKMLPECYKPPAGTYKSGKT